MYVALLLFYQRTFKYGNPSTEAGMGESGPGFEIREKFLEFLEFNKANW